MFFGSILIEFKELTLYTANYFEQLTFNTLIIKQESSQLLIKHPSWSQLYWDLIKKKNIIVNMDRKEYTPTKQSKLFTASSTYNPMLSRETVRGNGQLAIIREFQALKLQARQLEIQNRQLNTEVQKLRYQKNLNESKLIQKSSYEQQALNQFQKEKSYQIQMLKIKNEEDINRLRRQYEIKVEDILREIRTREIMNKQGSQKNSYVEQKACELRNNLENLEMELLRYRDSNSSLSEQLTREEFANKKLEMLEEELDRQKNEMETEIHILLDIEAEKSRAISTLEFQLQNSESSEKNLKEKLSLLTENFLTLEEHITIMKDRLGKADFQGQEIDKHLQSVEYTIADKQQLILEQKDREMRLRQEIDAHRQREQRRLLEIQHLMCQNQRAYHDLVSIRHRLYEVSIQQGFDF